MSNELNALLREQIDDILNNAASEDAFSQFLDLIEELPHELQQEFIRRFNEQLKEMPKSVEEEGDG
jgi:hypothetical protein